MLYLYNMSSEAQFDLIFKALGDSRRRRVLDLLRGGPRSTGQLVEAVGDLDRCTVMQHLAVLERAGLLVVRREGRVRWNYLNALPIQHIADRWIGRFAAGAAEKLATLRDEVEGGASATKNRAARGAA
jgi:DNA-binding transcriptional ArsR family regulator